MNRKKSLQRTKAEMSIASNRRLLHLAKPLPSIKLPVAFDAYLLYFYTKYFNIARQSISLTEPNDKWLKAQVDTKEYSSKSELVNDLIRQARGQQKKLDYIRMKIEKAEKSGFSHGSMEEILAQSKSSLNGSLSFK